MSQPRSFVIAPFDSSGARIHDTVQRALEEVGVSVFRADHAIQPGARWVNAITDAIRSSDFLVVDITRQNPNVFYELGFAHALRKPTILLMSSESESGIPSDLAEFQYIVYDADNLRSLVSHIQRAARSFLDDSEDDA